ncbi:MAG: hypothetical protein QGH60_20305 [Phycisphaerae bacterium]|jgi:hypothetical protein|nr:hypothetical protein [Phycisphaerae bacterium]
MFYDQKRRARVSGQFGVIALLISAMALLCGCDSTRPFGDTILDGLNTAGKATLGGLDTAGRTTVGSLQWVADGGQTGIRGRRHGSTSQPFFLVTGLRFPGIKLSELSVLSMEAVDGKGNTLLWKQGAWTDSKHGPALTITVVPAEGARTVDVTGVLVYRGGRWTLSARSRLVSGETEGVKTVAWRTELIDVIRQ